MLEFQWEGDDVRLCWGTRYHRASLSEKDSDAQEDDGVDILGANGMVRRSTEKIPQGEEGTVFLNSVLLSVVQMWAQNCELSIYDA